MPVLPNLLKAYKPIAAPARPGADPKASRRETFLKSLREQLALLDNPNLTRTIKVKGEEKKVPIRAWWFETPDGTVLAPRFGMRGLELAPGCTALKVNRAELKKALDGLAAAASAGELDAALEPKPPRKVAAVKAAK